MSCADLIYWSVFPENINLSKTDFEQIIPLSFRGQVSEPLCFSSNPAVARVDENFCVRVGLATGRSMIGIWQDATRKSLRYVCVEVGAICLVNADGGGSGGNTGNIAINGTVVNQSSGTLVASGTVRILDGSGSVVREIAISNGTFQTTLPSGSYGIQVNSDGFQAYSGTLTVSSTVVTGANISMSPIVLSGGLAMITLEWNTPSLQLEAHLTGPKLAGGPHFHIYHDHLEEPSEARLVRFTGTRRQQIQVFRYNHDQYRFYVHNLGARYENPSTSLGNSGARVSIETSQGTQVFQVPVGAGNLWRMLEIDGNTGQVHAINALGYLVDPAQPGM